MSRQSPGFWAVLQSVLAAAFGVQSEAARRRDFTQGRALPYILGGVVFTLLLIVGLILLVRLVLRQAGV
jgi:nitric oxide reductase large subunit